MSDLDDYQTPEGYGSTVGKCLTYEEIEALLAAERERCAKVADKMGADCRTSADGARPGRVQAFILSQAAQANNVAAAIRSLAPQTIGGE